MPCLFWEHMFDWGLADEINKLVGGTAWGSTAQQVYARGMVAGHNESEMCRRKPGMRKPAGAGRRVHARCSAPPPRAACAPCNPMQVSVRKRAGIRAGSKLEILAAEPDMYVARCNRNVTVKLGPRYDMPCELVPRKEDGWVLASSGHDFAVWLRKEKMD